MVFEPVSLAYKEWLMTQYKSESMQGESEICLNQPSKYRQISDRYTFEFVSKPEFIQI